MSCASRILYSKCRQALLQKHAGIPRKLTHTRTHVMRTHLQVVPGPAFGSLLFCPC